MTTKATPKDVGSLVLSLFPGIDLLGRGFEEEGYCIVRGPDLIYGGDMEKFHAPAGRFDGVIAGTPCQDYSRARRSPPTNHSDRSIEMFRRAVTEADPTWWLLENVPSVPTIKINGYSHMRIDLNAADCGSSQHRLRHFQFGHKKNMIPKVTRIPRQTLKQTQEQRCAIASEASRQDRRSWGDFCSLQGLPRDFALPGMSIAARYRAVGNGVPIPMARTIARAIAEALPSNKIKTCLCGCARPVNGKKKLATAACRKREQRKRDAAAVTAPGSVTRARSQKRIGDEGQPGCARSVTDLGDRARLNENKPITCRA